MAQLRFLIGRFLKIDGLVIQDFESVPSGVVTSIPALTGTNGCSLEIGTFIPRL